MVRYEISTLSRSRGFTLFELVIVLAIIAALAALVAPRVSKLPQRQVPNVVGFLEAERAKTVATGTATDIQLTGRSLVSRATAAELVLDEGTSIHLIHPKGNQYLDSTRLTVFYADGTMRAAEFRVQSDTASYVVNISPFEPRIRHANAAE